MAYAEKDFLGLVALTRTAPTADTVPTYLPSSVARPRNPLNNTYLPVIDRTGYPSIYVQGAKTPDIAVAAYIDVTTWTIAAMLNDLIVVPAASDPNLDTVTWSVGLYQAIAGSWRSYDGCKCARIDLDGDARGGPIRCVMHFNSIYGDNEASTPKFSGTFPASVPTTAQYHGPLSGTGKVSFTGADQVYSWRLTLVRGQAQQKFQDGTPYAADIASGGFSGVLTLEQSPTASTVSSTSLTLKINSATAGVGTNLNVALALNLDEYVQEKTTGIGSMVHTYSLIDVTAGGNPCVVSMV